MLGKIIGIGNTAEVYEWGEDQALKLFKSGYPLDAVEKEFGNAVAVENCDFDKPRVYSRMDYEGRYGILYERLDGTTLLDWVLKTRELETCADILAREHKRILHNKAAGVRKHKDILLWNIKNTHELPEAIREKVMEILHGLPDGDMLCHGDFHPGNIILHEGRRVVIDMMNICGGHKYSDIARSVYLIEMTPVPEGIGNPEELMKLKKYLTDCYISKIGLTRDDINQWLIVIAAARLNENCNPTEINTIIHFLNNSL